MPGPTKVDGGDAPEGGAQKPDGTRDGEEAPKGATLDLKAAAPAAAKKPDVVRNAGIAVGTSSATPAPRSMPAPPTPKPATNLKPHAEHPRQLISVAKINTMGAAEISAVAQDRGYDIPLTHSRGALKLAFLAAQEKDKGLIKVEE